MELIEEGDEVGDHKGARDKEDRQTQVHQLCFQVVAMQSVWADSLVGLVEQGLAYDHKCDDDMNPHKQSHHRAKVVLGQRVQDESIH